MIKNSSEDRKQTYFQLSSQITQLDSEQLRGLFDTSDPREGWGVNQTLEIDGTKVFVKRIPVTDLEMANMFSTRNLYDLPLYYNYGVSSAGFGVFRELLAHVKTTNWVLSGETENYPLLYHYRIMPFAGEQPDERPGNDPEMDHEEHQRHVAYWGGNENIGRFRFDRSNANYELVLFIEYIPHVLHWWILDHPEEVGQAFDGVRETIDFLRQKEIIHLDAHIRNFLCDGERVYLTDFGLVLDKSCLHHDDEKAFFDRHTYYDYGAAVACLSDLLFDIFEALPEENQHKLKETYGAKRADQKSDHLEGYDFGRLIFTLFENVEEIHAAGLMAINHTLLTCMIKYRSISVLMDDFYAELIPNSQKDTLFPDAELGRLLNETGFLPDAINSDELP